VRLGNTRLGGNVDQRVAEGRLFDITSNLAVYKTVGMGTRQIGAENRDDFVQAGVTDKGEVSALETQRCAEGEAPRSKVAVGLAAMLRVHFRRPC
jgi:hypothetical protein